MGEIVNGNNLDKNHSQKTRVKSTKFDIVEPLRGTYRFGEYGIAGCYTGIQGDKVKYRISSDVDSYTLKAPLKQPIYMQKDIFQVPRMAILPKNWDKIKINPSIGDDIDAQEYGTSLEADYFNVLIRNTETGINTALEGTGQGAPANVYYDTISTIMRGFILREMMLSNGSLLNALGAHTAELWHAYDMTEFNKINIDQYNEIFFELFRTAVGSENDIWEVKKYGASVNTFVRMGKSKMINANGVAKSITYKEFIQNLRDGDFYEIKKIYSGYSGSGANKISIEKTTANLYNYIRAIKNRIDGYKYEFSGLVNPLDLAKLWSYQLICAEFYTNDKVDYIYNAELYRQYIGNLVYNGYQNRYDTFEYNGITTEVDYLSAHYFKEMTAPGQGVIYDVHLYSYFTSIFKYNRSLRFKDYFTGARTRPIAIDTTGATTVEAGENVEVINIVKGIQAQRFLNVVNKIPRDIRGYTRGIFGTNVAPDWHNPLMLGKTRDIIYGTQTENTGEAQVTEKVSRTATLTNNGGKYQFEFNLDRDSIIMCIVWFDIERSYTRGIKRDFMWVDRFDMFDPYMQYTGDQVINKEELIAGYSGTFGYQGAYAELKQSYGNAFGGFINSLPGWIFTDQYTEDDENNELRYNTEIGPDFIRSKSTELDPFYINLTGKTLESYFHFIIENTNYFSASRKMAYNPQILG